MITLINSNIHVKKKLRDILEMLRYLIIIMGYLKTNTTEKCKWFCNGLANFCQMLHYLLQIVT